MRLEVNRAEMASLAVEGEDPERLTELRSALGLGDWENVSYPRMLQYLAGITPLPVAARVRV